MIDVNGAIVVGVDGSGGQAHGGGDSHHGVGSLADHGVPDGESAHEMEEFSAKLLTTHRIDDRICRRTGNGQRVQRQSNRLSD